MVGEDLYTSDEAAEIIGLSWPMIDYLCKQNVLRPTVQSSGRGTGRRWSFGDCLAARIGLEAVSRGIGWGSLRALVSCVARSRIDWTLQRPIAVLADNRAWLCGPDDPLPPDAGVVVLRCDLRPGIQELQRRAERVKAKRSKRRRMQAEREVSRC